MLYTIAVILLVFWALGLVTGTTINGFIHVLLIIAVAMILLRIISGRKAV
ncbi:MAG TPA: lmo0937 family membrane protein [Candidatus Acidoferrales bacterium]|jgi:hypothetical protein|nr:lmo0937 family membrane protein [Candidatus Acidoferrales bacterium]